MRAFVIATAHASHTIEKKKKNEIKSEQDLNLIGATMNIFLRNFIFGENFSICLIDDSMTQNNKWTHVGGDWKNNNKTIEQVKLA